MEPRYLGPHVILPDFIIPRLASQYSKYSGIDSPENCFDLKHFRQYPVDVSYQYNSRGYRDQEWPTSLEELQEAIWCIGDSTTVGTGCPISHTWPYLLQESTGRRTINVSMEGASNEWITRRTLAILKNIQPKTIVTQWAFFNRRESTNTKLPDEQRRLDHDKQSLLDDGKSDIENFKNCIELLEQNCGSTQIINSVTPMAFPGISSKEIAGWWNNHRESTWPILLPKQLNLIDNSIILELKKRNIYKNYYYHYLLQDYLNSKGIILVDNLDDNFQPERARDGMHWDIKTFTQFVNNVIKILH
jgi:hypothetical protein